MRVRLLTLLLVLLPLSAFGNAAPQTDYYVAIKGGISLGSYESGLNWAFLNYIHTNDDTNNLASFSGASAGSINSLLSALEHCQRDNTNSPVDNMFFKTWDIDLSRLLEEGKAEDALFSRNILLEKVDFLRNKFSVPAKRQCSIVITMSITRFEPYSVPFDGTGHDIKLQRFVVPLEVSADKAGDKIKFKNVYSPLNINQVSGEVPSVYVHLPEQPDKSIDFDLIKELAFASSAFPIAFSPRVIEHCFSIDAGKDKPCKAGENTQQGVKFSDGGLFDNSPIGVAVDIHSEKLVFSKGMDGQETPEVKSGAGNKSVIFYINPDNYRKRVYYPTAKEIKPADEQAEGKGTGVIEYGKYFYHSFDNATSFELQKTLVELEQPGPNKPKLITSNRFHHLLADFHAHFGAFYSVDFRMHDYIVGVYDGFSNIAAFKCGDYNLLSECRKKEVWKSIDTLFKGSNKQQKLYKDFITYLYTDEFAQNGDNVYTDNYLVALNKAFAETVGSSEKIKNKKVDMAKYFEMLSTLQEGEFAKAEFNEQTLTLMNRYDKWQSQQIEFAFQNVVTMQACGSDCNKINAVIGDYLAVSEPIVDSMLTHMDTREWPLSIDPSEKLPASFAVNLGFDVLEPSTVVGFKGRFPISRTATSIDVEANWHSLTAERLNDDYYSISAGLISHREGGTALFMPTWGVGFERSFEGDVYKHEDDAIYLAVGFLAEIVNIKWSTRAGDVDDNQAQKIRSNTRFLISVELGRIFDIVH